MKSKLISILLCIFLISGCNNERKEYIFDYQLTSSSKGIAAWEHYMDPSNPILLITDELIYDADNKVFLWHSKHYNKQTGAVYFDETHEMFLSFTNSTARFESEKTIDIYDISINNGQLSWLCEGYETVRVMPSCYNESLLKELVDNNQLSSK